MLEISDSLVFAALSNQTWQMLPVVHEVDGRNATENNFYFQIFSSQTLVEYKFTLVRLILQEWL